jgi:transposase
VLAARYPPPRVAPVAAQGTRVLVLIWDNAAWHVRWEVRVWLRAHNRRGKRDGQGVRILACFLPVKTPWLNAIEPKWTHTKKHIVESERLLAARELADRVCASLACDREPHLAMSKKVA